MISLKLETELGPALDDRMTCFVRSQSSHCGRVISFANGHGPRPRVSFIHRVLFSIHYACCKFLARRWNERPPVTGYGPTTWESSRKDRGRDLDQNTCSLDIMTRTRQTMTGGADAHMLPAARDFPCLHGEAADAALVQKLHVRAARDEPTGVNHSHEMWWALR